MSDSDQPLGLGCSEGFGTTPRWWHCDTHGPGNRTAWGCPECVREMRASLGRARGLLVELDSVLRMAESHNGGALTAAHVRAAVEPYLPLDLGPNVEFSGVPVGHSINHPAGGTSAGTQG